MQTHLGIDTELLAADGAYWTAREICQQPDVWIEADAELERRRPDIEDWLGPVLAATGRRIVLCGAGSSSFVGETLAPWLRHKLGHRVEAVSSTDLVGHPALVLAEDVPTLLVSFARSGDSPESVAAVELASRLLSDCRHLVLTCNIDGALARIAARDPAALCLALPERTNDCSFAMTSSFTAMLVACARIFAPDPVRFERAADMTRFAVDELAERARRLAAVPFERLVALGAGCLAGTAREACLKGLELTNGRLAALADTPLGFRHGPKCVVDESTCVVLLRSADPYTDRYDLDLLAELERDGRAAELVALSAATYGGETGAIDDFWLSLPDVVFCQMLAFFKARALGISPDNPCPSGEINRVVQGVRIHPYCG